MGFFDGAYHFLRYTNERPDMHLDIQILPRGGRSSYSYLLPYISQGRKTIIHVRTIDDVYRCFIYLSRAARPNEQLTRFRMYHAALPDEYNNETLVLMENDPHLQVIIGTVAFTFGINVKGILDSLTPRFPDTLDVSSQEKGRASVLAVEFGEEDKHRSGSMVPVQMKMM
jgi:superfamily II DNA helicase RecQ